MITYILILAASAGSRYWDTLHLCVKHLFYRVITTAGKGMATQDAAKSKPHPLESAITSNSIYSILRTGRCISTTGRKQRGNTVLVPFNEKQTNPACQGNTCFV